MIKLIGLHKKYADNHVLNDINYQFEKGTINGIVGQNGAGKTTLFNCIAGLLPYDGEIIFAEKDISIGFLPTQIYMYPKTTGIEFLNFCLSARGLKPTFQEIDAINELFKLPLRNKYTRNYSEGMKKQLHILMLLLQKNSVLILDEPFNNLDISTNIILHEVLKTFKNKKTIIISSHILDPLKHLCDTVSIIHDSDIKYSYQPEDFDKVDKYFFESEKSNIKSIMSTL